LFAALCHNALVMTHVCFIMVFISSVDVTFGWLVSTRVFLLSATKPRFPASVSVLQYACGQTRFISPARELSVRTDTSFHLAFCFGATT
jgi:hypothetical protein